MHPVFRPRQKRDRATCAYLYENGVVLVTFERWVADTKQTVRYAQAAESIGVRAKFQGRVVFHEPALFIAMASLPDAEITARPRSLDAGSAETKAKGIATSSVGCHSKAGTFFVYDTDVLSGSVTVQPDAVVESFAALCGDSPSGDPPVVRTFPAKAANDD